MNYQEFIKHIANKNKKEQEDFFKNEESATKDMEERTRKKAIFMQKQGVMQM